MTKPEKGNKEENVELIPDNLNMSKEIDF